MTETASTEPQLPENSSTSTEVPQQETNGDNDKKAPQDKDKKIKLYLDSGKTITEFCSLKLGGTTGVSTLLRWLEDKGYKMTKNDGSSELESKINELEDRLIEMTIKYEKAELLEAMRNRRNSV